VKRFHTLIDALNAAPGEQPFVTSWVDQDDNEEVSFAEFRHRARVQAKLLRAHDVDSEDRVVILMPQGIAAMTTFVGAMMLGAVPTILAYPNFKIEPSKYRAGLAGVSANLAAKAVVIDQQFPDDLLGYVALPNTSRLLRAGDPTQPDGSGPLPDLPNRSDSLAFIQHSAGTTGLQKGVALTHAAVLTHIAHLEQALHIDAVTDRIYSWLPLYHDMGLIACFMLPLVCHVPVVIQSPLDWVMYPETMLQVISKYKCTLSWMPNFAFQFAPRRIPASRWKDYDLSFVRAFVNCSEPVRATSLREFQNAFASIGLRPNALHSSYAMAENVFAVTQSDLRSADGPPCIWADGPRFRSEHLVASVAEGTPGAIVFVSSGQLLPRHEVRIVSGTGESLPHGFVGEILVRSDCLFQGYYNRPDLTAEALVDGWYHTGDLGFQWEGELYVVGRKKDLIIVGGENLYPQDIEEIAAGHPHIHDGRVVALGVYNPELGTQDIVVVAEVEREERLCDAPEIECEIRNRVVASLGVAVRAIYLKPPKWIVKSTAGKPARSSTREKLFRDHPELAVGSEGDQFA